MHDFYLIIFYDFYLKNFSFCLYIFLLILLSSPSVFSWNSLSFIETAILFFFVSFCLFFLVHWNSYFEFFTWYITDFHVFVCGYCDPLIVLFYFDSSYKFCIAVFALEVEVTSLSLYCLWGEK